MNALAVSGTLLNPRARWIFTICAGVGLISLLTALPLAPSRAWANLLLASFYLVGLGLGGVLFLAFDAVIEGGWATVFRRVPEAMACWIPVAAVGLVVFLILGSAVYPWIAEPPAGPFVTTLKQTWLTKPFFLVRAALYIAIWIAMAAAMVRTSRLQDADGDLAHTATNLRRSAQFLVLYGFTFWLASVDWIMSLDPHWASTIFGVYNFAGMFLSGIAAMSILVIWLGEHGPLKGLVTPNHYHDLGKLLFSFANFWFYIWFSQYLIIWYTNIPEEASRYMPQLTGAWGSLFLTNLLLNWAVPFLVLLPGSTKRNPRILLQVAIAVLVGRWLDLYLMIVPPVFVGGATVSYLEVGTILGLLGVAGLVIGRALVQAPLVPLRDPYLDESLHHHV